MNNLDTFKNREIVGKNAERLLERVIKTYFPEAVVTFNDKFDFNLLTNEDRVQLRKSDMMVLLKGEYMTIEVKNDIKSINSGNFAIQTYSRYHGYQNKDSGILTSTADRYFIQSGEWFYHIETKTLRTFITSNKDSLRPFFNNTSNTGGVLITIDQFMKLSGRKVNIPNC